MAGRKSILTPEIIREIGIVESSGCTDKACYESMGIHPSTWYEWLKRGEEDKENNKKSIHSEFSDTIKAATANMQIECINRIREASKNEWHAAAWILERTDPEHWGKREKLDINGQIPVTIVDDM